MCRDFKIFKVKVPMIFSGTQGFPARRVFRHAGIDVRYESPTLTTMLGSHS
jgi:hypothetical protein